MKKLLPALAIALSPSLVWGQGAVLQNGSITKFDAAEWIQDKMIESSSKMFRDNFRGFNPIHVFDNGGPGVCSESALTNGPYSSLCLGHDANGNGVLSLTPFNNAPGRTIELSINGVNIPFPGTVSGLSVVLSNAELQLLPSTYAALVVRQDFAAGNGAPPVFYASSSSPCSLNSGAGDGGAQIPTSNSGCWNMRPPAGGVYDVRIWGARVNGAADDSAAEIAANKAITTLYGGGTLLVPTTGNCMLGQGFVYGDETLGAGVIVKGAGVGACIKLKPNATANLIGTPNAYIYMDRYLTGAITQASSTIPVTDSTGFANLHTITVIAGDGSVHSATLNGTPSPTSISVNAGSWTNGAFSAPIGSWFTNFAYPGPPNSGLQDILLDGNECVPCNISNQSPVNNNVFASATHGTGPLSLQNGGVIRFAPGANLLQEFYSSGNLSAITYTITCSLQRADYTHSQVQFTFPGPNAGVRRTSSACNGYYSSTLTAAAVSAGGSGYTVNDILTVSGGTCETQPQVKVATLSGSAVATVTVQTAGICTTFPSNGGGTTGGTGSGATFTLTKRTDGISANNTAATALTIGSPDGVGSLDAIAHFGPMPRYKNVIVENFRGWGMRTGFGPGVGFYSPAPSGSNWQTQEGYIENIQVLNANAGAVWFNGPNDTRIKGITANFIYGFGVWFDRMSAGTVASDLHISGGFPDGVTQVEPQIGILVATDSITCTGCKSEEAAENIDIWGNNAVFPDFKVFHIDDGTDRIGVKIGDGNYVPANNLTKGYDAHGSCSDMGQGCFYAVTDGGGGRFHAKVTLGSNGHANYAGKPAFAGTPATCGTPGSDIDLQFVLPISGATVPLYRKPCTSWTPSLKFGGVAPAQTVAGEWYGDHAEFRIVVNGVPGTGAVTMNSPFGVNQTCIVHAGVLSSATGLPGPVNGIQQGGTVAFQQWSPVGAGTGPITETSTPSPFVGGTTLFGTIGPCITQ